MADTRLIERWLPIAALGIESVRERTPMTPFPAPNRLHVWWARRPLVAARTAILASLLPADADHDKFMRVLGIHGDPVAAKRRIEIADRRGERLGVDAYGYTRAFGWNPDRDDRTWMLANKVGRSIRVLDPTAGGGSIPLEAVRLGTEAISNDLNPVAALLEKATIEYPMLFGARLIPEFERIGKKLVQTVRERLSSFFPPEPDPNCRPDAYLWARTIRCPYCEGIVPLSPNWRLAPGGKGVKLRPQRGEGPGDPLRLCKFEIVDGVLTHSPGTVAMGDATCPFSDCGRVIDGDELRRQAQIGEVGQQLFAVAFKRRRETRTKSGRRGRDKWEREFRAPRPEDDNLSAIADRISAKMPEWDALGIMPNEEVESAHPKYDPRRWGMRRWRDFFSARQLLCHCTAVEVFREILAEEEAKSPLTDLKRAAYVYLALALDKLLDWNSALCAWNPPRELMAHTFQRHDFAFIWSYAEMAAVVEGQGFDWAIAQTGKCISELVQMTRTDGSAAGGLFSDNDLGLSRPFITAKSGDVLDHVPDSSVDLVVMDPPYYDNVMYAELSDFFYVWLKRTAGYVVPELFTRTLTDKENEAVANPQKFAGQKGARELAGRDYQERMQRIFEECRRVLKSAGLMTLMTGPPATEPAASSALQGASKSKGGSNPIRVPILGRFSPNMPVT
jgi:putative DNA methylase